MGDMTNTVLQHDEVRSTRVIWRERAQDPLMFVVVMAFLLVAATLPNVLSRLDPLTGDEPFYVMTAISIIRDGDLDEANNYAQRDFDELARGVEELRRRVDALEGRSNGGSPERAGDRPDGAPGGEGAGG